MHSGGEYMPDLLLFLIAISYFVFIVSIKLLMNSMDISRKVKARCNVVLLVAVILLAIGYATALNDIMFSAISYFTVVALLIFVINLKFKKE